MSGTHVVQLHDRVPVVCVPGTVAEGATGVWGSIKGWTADRLARSSSSSLDGSLDGDDADSDEDQDEEGLSMEERKGGNHS
jgi:hypothetical protein